jgi:hypothetical protein
MPDGTYTRGPAYLCNSPDAIRASQKEDFYDPNITIQPIGKVCWSCRGEFYNWNGVNEKPLHIQRLEAGRVLIQEAEKVPDVESASEPVIAKVKSRKKVTKPKRVEDPSKKRKSANRGLL